VFPSLRHTCALTEAGTAFCWGNGNGLGTGQTGGPLPQQVAGDLTFATLSTAVGDYVSCGLLADGRAYCWGPDHPNRGGLGTGSIGSSPTPVAIGGDLRFASIAVGQFHTCTVSTDGAAYCLGGNWSGQLGIGSAGGEGGTLTLPSATPAPKVRCPSAPRGQALPRSCPAPAVQVCSGGLSSLPGHRVSNPRDQLQADLAERYVLERELGRGGMATVYLARDLRHDRLVALKVLRPDLAATLGPERFLQEIKLAARLQHPHILPMFDSGEAEGSLWYAMPFVEGESLRDRLAREGELPVGDAVRVLRDIGSALAYAHRHGIVHRDIKPANVLLLSDGGALVADFGVAKALSAAAHDGGLTMSGLVVGTPAYMAPEQAAGDPTADHRADLYSLGLVAYELLTGQPPFLGRTPQALLAAHATENPEPVSKRRPALSPALAALVMRLLEKRPADRPQTANDVLRALEDVATPASGATLTKFRGPVRRPLLWAAMVILAALLVSGGLLARRAWSSGLNPQRIAVAVFENRTGDPSLDPVGSMAADWITQGLAQTAMIDVVDVGAVYLQGRTPSGQPTAPRQLARQNGAGLVVAGAYYRSADSVVIQASVVDTRSGRVLRAFDPVHAPVRTAEEALVVLRERVMGGVAVLLSARVSPILAAEARPPNFAAYREFLAAQEAWYNGLTTDALSHATRSAALDSSFVTAAAWVSAIAAQLGRCRIADSIGSPLRARPELSEWNRSLLDRTHAQCGGDVEERYKAARRLAALYPKSSYARFTYAVYTVAANRPHEALGVLLGLDPVRDLGFISDSGRALYYRPVTEAYHLLGQYGTELRIAEDFTRRNPNRLAGVYWETRALAALGRDKEVLRRLDAAEDLPADSASLSALTTGSVDCRAASQLLAHGDSNAARAAAERALRWYHSRSAEEQSTHESRYWLTRALELHADYEPAAALLARLMSEDTADVRYLRYQGMAGVVAARRGDRVAVDSIDRALAAARPPSSQNAAHYRAAIAAVLGDRDRAVSLLRASPFSEGRDYLIAPEPALTLLRGYPPFEALLRPRD
jgi:TolB-like protein